MMRNDQNGKTTGGQFSRGTVSRPAIGASGECFRISEPSFGIPIAYSSFPAAWLGQPNRYSGAPSLWLSKWPSIAMIFTGWCSSVLRPCWSPATIWIGATMVAIHIAMENITRAPAWCGSRSRWNAPTAPTTKAVVRYAASTMCTRR